MESRLLRWRDLCFGLLVVSVFGCRSDQTLVSRSTLTPSSYVIHNVAVLDVVTGTVSGPRDVWIDGDKIKTIGPVTVHAPAERIIDGTGQTLMPGLIDFHGHTGSNPEPPWDAGLPNVSLNLARFLFAGVTRVLDPGARDDEAVPLRNDIEAGEILGPSLAVAGPIFTAPGGHPVPMLENGMPAILEWYLIPHLARQVGTPEAAKTAVEAYLDEQDSDFIKIAVDKLPASAPRMSPDVAKAIVDAARAKNVRVVAHIGTATDAIDAAEAGVSAWLHGVYKARLSDAEVARLAAFGIPMAPTLVVFDSYATLGRAPRLSTALEREMVDESELRKYDKQPDDFIVPEEMLAVLDLAAQQRQDSKDNVRRLHAAGVTIMAGSDAQAGVFHGAGLHRELVLLSESGLETIEVLRAATLYPSRFLSQKEDPPYGVVAEGKIADLLLVAGNPLADLAAVSKINRVILRGRPLIRQRR